MRKLFYRTVLILGMVTLSYSLFMAIVDPYVLIGNEVKRKTLPNYHLYSYNFFKKYKTLDFGFLGSSVVNYYDIEYMYPNKNVYSMGIESSTIQEQIEFGKLMVNKHPKEITFFLSFYSFNPSRNCENYFNRFVISNSNIFFDFIYQYLNKNAYDDAFYYIEKGKSNTKWEQQFNLNGTRTQNHYKHDTSYSFKKVLADYIVLNNIDRRLYASNAFRKSASIDEAINKIKVFKSYVESNGIKFSLVMAPDHRMNTTMIYYSGLGSTFEYLRKKIAEVQSFYDLNLDTAFASNDLNYWDAHHVRDGKHVIDDLKLQTFLVDSKKVESSFNILRPSENEIKKLKAILAGYKNWNKAKATAIQDEIITPLLVE